MACNHCWAAAGRVPLAQLGLASVALAFLFSKPSGEPYCPAGWLLPRLEPLWYMGEGVLHWTAVTEAWWLAEHVWHSQEVSRDSASAFVTVFKGTLP